MSDELVKRLRAIDQFSVEDCFVQSALYEKAAARIEAQAAAISAALERLDASLFTNAEHQQAKDILREARKPSLDA